MTHCVVSCCPRNWNTNGGRKVETPLINFDREHHRVCTVRKYVSIKQSSLITCTDAKIGERYKPLSCDGNNRRNSIHERIYISLKRLLTFYNNFWTHFVNKLSPINIVGRKRMTRTGRVHIFYLCSIHLIHTGLIKIREMLRKIKREGH
jgi:hypothetical protein